MTHTEMKALSDQLIKNNNGDIEVLAVWTIGYIDALEESENNLRLQLQCVELQTLKDTLNEQIKGSKK